jgi:hypothetical protein
VEIASFEHDMVLVNRPDDLTLSQREEEGYPFHVKRAHGPKKRKAEYDAKLLIGSSNVQKGKPGYDVREGVSLLLNEK